MSQRDLERAVSRATGESVSTVRHLGFLLADEETLSPGDDLDVEVLDWDVLCGERSRAYPSYPQPAFAGC